MAVFSLNDLYGDESGQIRLTRAQAVEMGADLDGDGDVSDAERERVGSAFDTLDVADGSAADGVLDHQDRVDAGHREELEVIAAVGERAFMTGLAPDNGIHPERLAVSARAFNAVATLASPGYRQIAARSYINLGHVLDNESRVATGRRNRVLRAEAAQRQFANARLQAAEAVRGSEEGTPAHEEAGLLGWEASFYESRMFAYGFRVAFGENASSAPRHLQQKMLCALAGMHAALEHIENRVDEQIAEGTRGTVGETFENQEQLHKTKLSCGIPSQER